MIADYSGKAVLVTGGTMGIGLATALAFAARGAHCTLTHRFGSADEDDVRRKFAEAGSPLPNIIQADVANDEDTEMVLAEIKKTHDHIEAFISNVSVALVVKDLSDYSLRGLCQSIEFSAWPMWEYTKRIKAAFGRYPRYVVGMSSSGPDSYSLGYDFVASSKAVMETLNRYMNYRLFDEDIRVNVIRSRNVRTDSFRLTFGTEFEKFAKRYTQENHFIETDEVANATLALCSGLMDGVSGQVIMVDRGITFFDNIMRLYAEREKLGI